MPLRRSPPIFRFYRKHADKNLSNPLRRGLYGYILTGGVVGGVCYLTLMYQLAGWEAQKLGDASGRFVCSSGLMDFFCLLPLNRISNLFGSLVDAGTLPASVHRFLINFIVRYYHVDLGESQKSTFDSLQDFYTREWKPECRTVNSQARVVCPCDGVIVEVHEDITTNTLVQVKGINYGIQSLFRVCPPAVPEACKRVAVVFHLRVFDFHNVISPINFNCEESIYVPGTLLPATVAGCHWLPRLLTLNERVVVRGNIFDKTKGSVFLAMVGSTLSGKIKLHFDHRICTNFLDPPDYAVFLQYKAKPLFTAGSLLGTFLWGSSVVLMVDVPRSVEFRLKRGDTARAGEALLV